MFEEEREMAWCSDGPNDDEEEDDEDEDVEERTSVRIFNDGLNEAVYGDSWDDEDE